MLVVSILIKLTGIFEGVQAMRDSARLYDFYDRLSTMHITKFPDWRFGQLICNFETWMKYEKGTSDIFYIEDGKMAAYIEEFADHMIQGEL